jgi:hypothetical protein
MPCHGQRGHFFEDRMRHLYSTSEQSVVTQYTESFDLSKSDTPHPLILDAPSFHDPRIPRSNARFLIRPDTSETTHAAHTPFGTLSLPSRMDICSLPSVEMLSPKTSLWHGLQARLQMLPWWAWVYVLVCVSISFGVLLNYKPVLSWLHALSAHLASIHVL